MPVAPCGQHAPVLPPADCVCVADWSALFELLAVAPELTELVCVTEPPFPGLSTRMGVLLFFACSCDAREPASAAWALLDPCPAIWMPRPEPDPLDWFCVASCDDEFWFAADASLSTLFVCSTSPSFPGLSTRIDAFLFEASLCTAFEPASAACSFHAPWLAVWMPVAPCGQHAPVLLPPDDCV
jgi:hypothetical protein